MLRDFEDEKLCEESLDFLKEVLGDLEKVNEKIKCQLNDEKGYIENELYYVYSYSPEKIYITQRGSSAVKQLKGVSADFANNLAEGFILRYKNGKFIIDEELTEKSMNFELDFDNYIE